MKEAKHRHSVIHVDKRNHRASDKNNRFNKFADNLPTGRGSLQEQNGVPVPMLCGLVQLVDAVLHYALTGRKEA
jgi:hypothetical protein